MARPRDGRWRRPCASAPAAPAAEKVKKESVGFTRAYEILGELPMMHEGRIKPIDTVAREEIKSIYTRETIKLTSEDGKTVTSWSPVAAFFDWSVRPKFWDAPADHRRRVAPAEAVHPPGRDQDRPRDRSPARPRSSEADRARIKAVGGPRRDRRREPLRAAVRDGKLAEDDARAVEKLAAKVGEETKWLSPDDLEDAEVTVDGKADAVRPVARRPDAIAASGPGRCGPASPSSPTLEQKAFDVGMKLARYRAIRDKETFGAVPLLVAPHPAGQATLNYSAEAYKKAEEQGPRSLAPLELEAANTLHKYLNDLPSKDRAMPGDRPRVRRQVHRRGSRRSRPGSRSA